MTPLPQVPESKSIKLTFTGLSESYRVFAIIKAFSLDSLRELRDSVGRTFFVASSNNGWVSRLSIALHRLQQPTGLRTALIHASQSLENVLIRDYDTAQIYRANIISIDPAHRTRIKWADETFHVELAVLNEGVFNLTDESQIIWRDNNSVLVPERGYPY